MPPRLRTCAIVLALGWPIGLHLAAVSGHEGWMPAITAIAAIGAVGVWVATKGTSSAIVAGVAMTLALVSVLLVAPRALLFGPPILINAALCAVFARSLRQGNEPVIAVFARLEQGTLTPELADYTRILTGLWSILFFGLAATALYLAIFASVSAWSWFANCAAYAAVALLFVGEYVYRRMRFPQYRHASLVRLLRNVAGSATWRSGARDE
jgi:uncharacterized membrane protein